MYLFEVTAFLAENTFLSLYRCNLQRRYNMNYVFEKNGNVRKCTWLADATHEMLSLNIASIKLSIS